MLTMEFDYEKLAEAFEPRIEKIIQVALDNRSTIEELPPMLTRTRLMEVLHIGPTKAAELLGRSDFPVMREAGVLIPTHMLFKWIERHTRWVEDNTGYFQVV